MKSRFFYYGRYWVSVLLFSFPMISYTSYDLPEVAVPDSLVAPEKPVVDQLPPQPLPPAFTALPISPHSAEPASPTFLATPPPFPDFSVPAYQANLINIISQQLWMDKSNHIDSSRLSPHSSTVQRVTIHHTATPQSKNIRLSLKGMQRYHQIEKGWVDIAYHYLIAPDGKIYEGRNAAYMGSSSTDYELDNNLMIALIGNFEESPPSEPALLALKNLVVSRLIKYKLQPEAVYTHGEQVHTLCPGRYLEDWYVDTGKAAISTQFYASLPAS